MSWDLKVSDITIITREEWPYTICEHPSASTITFLHAMFENARFQDWYKKMHEEYSLTTKENYELLIIDSEESREEEVIKHHKILSEIHSAYDLYAFDIEEITITFQLPETMKFNFFLLLLFNSFIDLKYPEFPEIYYLENPAEIAEAYKRSEELEYNISAIVFKHQITKNDFKKWIDENWQYIENDMLNLPHYPIYANRMTDIGLVSKVYELHKSGKSNTEIIEIILQQTPNNGYDETADKVTDDWINNKIKRFSLIINKYNSYLDELASFFDEDD